MRRIPSLLAIALLILLSACGKADTESLAPAVPTTGTISGKIIVPGSSGGSGKPEFIESTANDGGWVIVNGVKQSKLNPQADFVPGEVIVKFRPSKASIENGATMLIGKYESAGMQKKSDIGALNASVLRTKVYRDWQSGRTKMDRAKSETVKFIEELRRDPLVEYAEPNYLRYAMQSAEEKHPNDDKYQNGEMWHYEMIKLPEAWYAVSQVGTDVNEIGRSDVIVAVLDTGFVMDHPDLSGNLLVSDGYDFVQDTINSQDGDGYDANPSFPRDFARDIYNSNVTQPLGPLTDKFITDLRARDASDADIVKYLKSNAGQYVSHGTHVAGTISAVTHDRQDIAGVGWNVKIMPVRVIGVIGVSDDDNANAILYAARITNASGKLPSRKANIINMSLGGPAKPNPLVQDAINRARTEGVIIVVASGNNARNDKNTAVDNSTYYPAAYTGVIGVGSVGQTKLRAVYSNYASGVVDLCAPGGNLNPFYYSPSSGKLLENASYKDSGIISTMFDVNTDKHTHRRLEGTSMATPHVAGVIALMQSARLKAGLPLLTPQEVDDLISQGKITDSPTPEYPTPGSRNDEYGYGLINALKAVREALNLAPPPTPDLLVEPEQIVFDRYVSQRKITIYKEGSGVVTVNSVTANVTWMSATLNTTVSGNLVATITVDVNRSGIADGYYNGEVTINTTAGVETVDVEMEKKAVENLGTITVLLRDNNGSIAGRTTTSADQGYAYQISNVSPGSYVVEAGVDKNGNDRFGDVWDEYVGEFPRRGEPSAISVAAGATSSNIDISIIKSSDLSSHPGNGYAPNAGVILATVLDEAEGTPIGGAKVYLGSGAYSGETDISGKMVIRGNFSGAQTVTATAPGYTTMTYVQTNSSFISFFLSPKVSSAAKYSFTVTVSGLLPGETGFVAVNMNDVQTFAYAGGADPVLTFSDVVEEDETVNVSAISYNGGAQRGFDHKHYLDGVSSDTAVTLAMAAPPSWKTINGSVIAPSGSFDAGDAPLTYFASGYSYLGYVDGAIYIGLSNVSGSPGAWTTRLAETDEPQFNTVFAGVINKTRQQQSLAFTHASFSTLPANVSYTLMDVAGLTQPADASAPGTLTPTFSWSNPSGADLIELEIENTATGEKWDIILPSSLNSFTLPSIPTGGLSSSTTYTWMISAYDVPSFNYNDFHWKQVVQTVDRLSISQKWKFTTP